MNTTVKKVVVKKAAAKKIENPLYRMNHGDYNNVSSVIDSIMSDIEEDSDFNFECKILNQLVRFRFNQNTFCCGLIEIGELEISGPPAGKTSTAFLKAFSDLINELINVKEGNTLMLTTNGRDSSVYFEKVLSKSESWTAIKSFRNSNSGNTVTIWISNN